MTRLLLAALILSSAAGAAALRNPADQPRYEHCLGLAKTAPDDALAYATQWRANGGGVPARQCSGLAYLSKKDFSAATAALDGASRAAEATSDPMTAALWGQTGNAALLAGKPDAALAAFNAGLASASLTDLDRADMLIDRARAHVELKSYDAARADVAKAVMLDPGSPDGWLLTATLERSAGNLPAAEAAVLKAGQYADGDPEVAVEAGNIAYAQGKVKLARAAWEAVVKVTPDSDAGKVAAAALAAHPDKTD